MISISRGFTLIELLVVIAIIGLLSAMALASLNSARSKGGDSAVKNQMAALRSQAELYYDANGNSYANICGIAPVGGIKPLGGMLLAASDITGAGAVVTSGAGAPGKVTCHAAAGTWVAEAPLKSNTANMWCVDSAGHSKASAAGTYMGAAATACL